MRHPRLSHRLSRRRALAQVGAGVAAAGAGLHLPKPTLARQDNATPTADGQGGQPPLGVVTPERVTLAVDQLPKLVEDLLERSGVPGLAVAVVHDDAVAFLGGFGVRELGQDAPIEPDTVFQLASVSKPIAATVVSALVGDGTVDWASRVADLDPNFALHDAWPTQEVSLADLFSHRSGLPDHAGDILEDLGFTRDDILARLRYLEPAYSFRSGYAYTNFGLTAAAVAAARAAGDTWEDLSTERLYQPLGMTQTSSRFDDYLAAENRAIPHVRIGAEWVITPDQRNPDAQTPAGGVSSTANDLVQWLRLHLGQGQLDGQTVIPADAFAPMHLPHSVSGPVTNPATERASFYGLGIGVSYDDFGAVRWSHSGAFALGAATAVYLLPGAGFGVAVLTNGYPVGVPEALSLSLLDLVQRGDITRDWFALISPAFAAMIEPTYGTGTTWDTPPDPAAPSLGDDAYVGTYENAFYGSVTVAHTVDGLRLEIGPNATEYPLTHYDRDTFFWTPPGENAALPSGLSFTMGGDGRALSFRDEYLTSGGPGVLGREA